MIVAVIVACEIAFWVAIGAGLTARYPLKRPHLGLVILASVPLIDLVLLIATVVSLRAGATAGVEHGLAAIYIGFSLAYGHRMIAWADVRFAYCFAGGPPPVKLYGAAYTRHCWGGVLRTAIAALIASGLTAALIAMVGDPVRTQSLAANFGWLGIVFVVDLVWAVSTVIWPREEPKSVDESTDSRPVTRDFVP